MSASTSSSYEEVPYEGFALFLTHPDHLAALGRLYEMSSPPDVETCRVLELGCARGENLIPMAFSLPRAQLVGIERSPRQVAEGRATIAALGLENIELREESITDLGPDLGSFDFILAQGVYSWVPEPVQEKLLDLCAEHLAPNGLAYVSFNTYPGWHMRTMIRDMMLFHARNIAGTRARVQVSRNLMRGLAQVLAKYDNPYARCLWEEAEGLGSQSDSYLAHEYLEDTNQPIYLHQFVDRVAAHGLKYLAEAQFWTTAAAQPFERFQALSDFALDWLDREQLYDSLKGRAFRQAVLCRDGVPCLREPSARALMSLRITSLIRPSVQSRPLGPDESEDFQNFRGEVILSTSNPLIKAALRILHEAWPRSLPFATLWALVEARLTLSGDKDDSKTSPSTSAAQLAEAMLGAFAHNIIELHVYEPAFTTELSDLPRASPIARHQAAAGRVANSRNRMVKLMDFDRFLLPLVDGRRDRLALLAELQGAIEGGVLTIQSQGRPITDPSEAEPILMRLLEESLQRLAACTLLVG
jgi:SAM-dependent methyltransferase